jgi:hypothetical protein
LTIPAGSGNLAGVARKLRVEYPGAIYHAHGNDDDIEVDRPTAEDGRDGHVASCLRKNE